MRRLEGEERAGATRTEFSLSGCVYHPLTFNIMMIYCTVNSGNNSESEMGDDDNVSCVQGHSRWSVERGSDRGGGRVGGGGLTLAGLHQATSRVRKWSRTRAATYTLPMMGSRLWYLGAEGGGWSVRESLGIYIPLYSFPHGSVRSSGHHIIHLYTGERD